MGLSFSSITDKLGFTDHDAEEHSMAIAEDQLELASKQVDYSNEISEREIAFQKEQYNDWKDVYGDLQEDVGTYFQNITGDSLTVQKLGDIQTEYQQAQANIDTQLAQRGLSGSGLAAQAMISNSQVVAGEKARVRSDAERLANEQKMGFIGLGLGQGAEMLGSQASLGASSASTGMSGANAAMGSASSILGSSLGLTGTGLQVTGSKSEEIGTSITGMFG